MKIKYIHLRNYDVYGYPTTKGGKTIAFQVDGDKVRYAIAHCNEGDNFCRRIGRLIAAGRLAKGGYGAVVRFPEGTPNKEIVKELASIWG